MVADDLGLGGDAVHRAGQVDVKAAEAVAVMRGQGDVDDVVDVAPFGVVVQLFGLKRGARRAVSLAFAQAA